MTTTSELLQIKRACETLEAQCQISANEAAAAAALLGGAAPLNSPAFTGEPTAPTPPVNSNNDLLATTAYLDTLKGASNGLPTLDSTGHIPTAQLPSSVLGGLNYIGVWNAATNTPTLVSGSGTDGNFYIVNVSGTASIDGNSTWVVGDQIVFGPSAWKRVPIVYTPTTNIPLSALATQTASTLVGNNGTGTVVPFAISISAILALSPTAGGATGTSGGSRGWVPAPASGDNVKFLMGDMTWGAAPTPDLSTYAKINSQAFTGTPTTATVARATSSTAIATTEFVLANLATASEILPVVNGTAAQGTSTYGARVDHVHPTDTSRAPATGIALSSLAAQAPSTFVANGTAGTATPVAVTAVAATALLSAMVGAAGTAGGTKGLVPAPSAAGTVGQLYLNDGGTFTAPSGGQPVPASSSFAVGTLLLCALATGTIGDGSTTAGSNLQSMVFTGDVAGGSFTGGPSGSALSGTWKNVSGATLSANSGFSTKVGGYFVRTA